MIFQEKVSFDGKQWYQLEWDDVEFYEIDKIIESCSDINSLLKSINDTYPKCNIRNYLLENHKPNKVIKKKKER